MDSSRQIGSLLSDIVRILKDDAVLIKMNEFQKQLETGYDINEIFEKICAYVEGLSHNEKEPIRAIFLAHTISNLKIAHRLERLEQRITLLSNSTTDEIQKIKKRLESAEHGLLR